jgi:hypothetical protein
VSVDLRFRARVFVLVDTMRSPHRMLWQGRVGYIEIVWKDRTSELTKGVPARHRRKPRRADIHTVGVHFLRSVVASSERMQRNNRQPAFRFCCIWETGTIPSFG